MDITIHSAQEPDHQGITEILGEAFSTQPSTLAIYGGKKDLARRMGLVFGAMLHCMDGEVFVARNRGRIVGAMRMVQWPGCQLRPTQGIRMLPRLLRSGGLGCAVRGMKMRSTWARNDPQEPHWHLDPLGVHPDLQGKGVGSRMMEFYCARIDKEPVAAYHETDRPENVAFYEKFGFEVVGEEKILGFDNWYMRRPPRTVGVATRRSPP